MMSQKVVNKKLVKLFDAKSSKPKNGSLTTDSNVAHYYTGTALS